MPNEFVNVFIIILAAVSFVWLAYSESKRSQEHAFRIWQFEAIKAKMAIEALEHISSDTRFNFEAREYAHSVLNRLHKQMELTG